MFVKLLPRNTEKSLLNHYCEQVAIDFGGPYPNGLMQPYASSCAERIKV